MRRGGNRVRITAKLIDALSGKHLWAQRYDRELQGVFAIQDDVTSSIVAVLPARIEAAATEAAARKNVDSLEAYDCLLRGKYYHHLYDAKANQEAEASFDRAIELDPRFCCGLRLEGMHARPSAKQWIPRSCTGAFGNRAVG